MTLSDLYRVVQDVPGVVFADIDRLLFKKPAGMTDSVPGVPRLAGCNDSADGCPNRCKAGCGCFRRGRWRRNPGVVLPAELAALQNPG